MPALILTSRQSSDSKQLRQAAQQSGWETLRLDGTTLPEWFDPPDEEIALFYTAPHAFEIAAQLGRMLLGCGPEWTPGLPAEFLRREMRQMTLEAALRLAGRAFIKHSLSKAFPAAIYDSASLAEATPRVPPGSLVNVVEPVEWAVEYRAFILEREVATISPYRRHGAIIQDHADLLGADPAEIAAARSYAASVVRAVECPPAFVLDVGVIEGRGWAVVEPNECWAAGIYACDPQQVLATLVRACVLQDSVADRGWDFQRHYARACPQPQLP